MLLRRCRSSTIIGTTASTAKITGISIVRAAAAATTTLLGQHRRRFLRPRVIRSAVFCTAPSPNDREGMENKKKDGGGDDDDHKKKYEPHEAVGDTMWHSFGAGYGTRSDEEGFGGIYGGNDPIENPGHHANHPEYDKSQGSEVKEKEKARNLTDEAAATGHSHDRGTTAAEKS